MLIYSFSTLIVLLYKLKELKLMFEWLKDFTNQTYKNQISIN